ncbi:MAG: hypothetical protein IT305_13005 [Chloroflexi bacterium]|nr:hypothetical protein [Chloroflexota bacterium]
MRFTWLLTPLLIVGAVLQPAAVRVSAEACSPAVNAAMQVLDRAGDEPTAVQVIVEAGGAPGTNLLRRIAITDASNAIIEVEGAPAPVPSVLTPDSDDTAWSFVARKVDRGVPFLVTYVATDRCGDVAKFAGSGVNAQPGGQPIGQPAAPGKPPTAPRTPTATPTSTRIPAPTRTPSPTRTPASTSTSVPAPTSTPIPASPTAVSPTTTPTQAPAGPTNALAGPYTRPEYFTGLPWGAHSHWIQPWRAYLETVPATTFVDGLGMHLNLQGEDPDLVMRMLAANGIRRVRIEVGWGKLAYDESRFDMPELPAQLAAARRYGIRPLLLLNSNQGLPCPTRAVTRTVTAPASSGATTLQLDDTSGLIPGYSGVSNITGFWAAEALVTAIDGKTVTLSKPLPYAVPAGATALMATLRYRPFSVPGSADYQATMAGWLSYVDKVAAVATAELGTSGAADKGFDLEIWNELTFGSAFLGINSYYAGAPYQYDDLSILRNLIVATTAHIEANSATFTGVHVSNGFASTMPWQAASTEPARVAALSKHPYPPRLAFPANEQRGQGLVGVNALGQVDSYVPTYAARFPEYFGTAIQTETQVRDMGPFTNLVAGTAHGRNARPSGPVETWMTEANLAYNWSDMSPSMPVNSIEQFKAKVISRFAAFYLNKGVSQIFFFGVNDTGPGDDVSMVADNFLSLARRAGAAYPADDSSYTSSSLLVLRRMAARLTGGLDRSLASTRALSIGSVTDTHNHAQFAGDGTAAHPPLYDREVLAILPFQVNTGRFVIPYYVMTRDVLQPLTPEQFTVRLDGLHGTGATVTAYDPVRDTDVPVEVVASSANSLTVRLTAADYPYLLTVQES